MITSFPSISRILFPHFSISFSVPPPFIQNKKAELTKGSSFGSSAVLKLFQHPPLSVPFSRRVWLYRENRISVLGIQLINIRKMFFVNMENEIVKIIFLVYYSDEKGALGEVSNVEK